MRTLQISGFSKPDHHCSRPTGRTPVRAAAIRDASPPVACSQQAPWLGQRWEVVPAARSRELRRMGWPGRLGANEAAGPRGLPAGFDSPKVHGSTALFDQALLLAPLAPVGLLAPLDLSPRAHLPRPRPRTRQLFRVALVCGTPGGSRAMPSPYQGTLACPKPGTQGDLRPHVTDPLSAEF